MQSALVLEAVGDDALEGVMVGSSLAVFLGAEHGFTLDAEAVSGEAELVPGGGEAGLLIIVADDDGEQVIVACDASAVTRTALRSLGLASSAPARIRCDAVAARVLVRGEQALEAIELAQNAAFIGVTAIAVGGGSACLEAARRHASERIAFGKPLLAQHAVVRKLAESRQGIAAARHLGWHAARLADLGEDPGEVARQARILAVDAMVHAADEAIQIHGGFGYTVEYHVERHYRDGKTLEVLDGGSERLRDALAAGVAQ